MQLLVIYWALLLLATTTGSMAFDYCAASKELCPMIPGARHVVCNGRKFSPACKDPKLIKMKPNYQTQILEFHNRLRNNLACGYFHRYAEASSMEQLMIHANTQYIGCAMVRFRGIQQGLPVTQYYLVCNYSEGNLYERPVYRKGKRCSKCKYGCSNDTSYRCLCRSFVRN
uniref:SCP domain-containing protein n=1 Tax=Anopheles maculatus TaxID=74869 RepID=A0A182T6J0_9DIPT